MRIAVAGVASEGWLTTFMRKLRASFFWEFTIVFAFIALLVSLAAGVAVSTFITSDIRDKTLDDLSRQIEQIASRQIVRELEPGQLDAPLIGAELAAFDRYVRESILDPRTIRVNVFNPDGLVIYSTEPSLRGRSYGTGGHLGAALAGRTDAKVEEVQLAEDPGEHSGLPTKAPLVEVYTPLKYTDSSPVLGAFEIYSDYGPIAAHIGDVQSSVYIGIAAALAFIYFSLLILVKRGSDLIKRQQRDIQGRTHDLKNSYDSIVSVLCAALDLRDNVTSGHAQRVSELASVVAWQMGLRKENVRLIEQAAILHDIGKIGVADSILSKPDALTHDEWREMRKHPELGYHILKDIDFLKDAAQIVYAHHERFDGSGYPRALRGDDIPLGARIFAVIDAYDAMTSHRPYRKAVSHNAAVEEIRRHAGTQFDPQVVQAFLEAERRGLIQGHAQTHDAAPSLPPHVARSPRRSPSPKSSP